MENEHIHQYKRVKGSKVQYMCGMAKCPHFKHKKFLIGKASLCNSCGTEFILTEEHLRRARPLCLNCANTKEARVFQERKRIFEEIKTAVGGENEEVLFRGPTS